MRSFNNTLMFFRFVREIYRMSEKSAAKNMIQGLQVMTGEHMV